MTHQRRHVAGHVNRGDTASSICSGVLQGEIGAIEVEQALNDRVVVVNGRTQGAVRRSRAKRGRAGHGAHAASR